MSFHPARTALRKDANHAEIVKELRHRGYSVLTLSSGCDIAVGIQGMNFLFEIKRGDLPKSARLLTDAELKFAQGWRGQLSTVTSVEQIEQIIQQKLSIWERGSLRTLKEMKGR